MPFMMNTETQKQVGAAEAHADEKSWDQLFGNIRTLALRRSEALLAEDEETEAFDRGARVLRTLMSSAEVAQRMLRNEEKETETDEGSQDPVISDEDIRRVKRKLEQQIARIDEEDRVGPQRTDAGAGAASQAQTA